jgi:hypothetical protein
MALRIRCHLLRALACARSHSALSRLCFSLPATDTSAPAPLVGPAPSASGVPFMLLCGAMHSLRLAAMRSRFTFSSDGAQRGASHVVVPCLTLSMIERLWRWEANEENAKTLSKASSTIWRALLKA